MYYSLIFWCNNTKLGLSHMSLYNLIPELFSIRIWCLFHLIIISTQYMQPLLFLWCIWLPLYPFVRSRWNTANWKNVEIMLDIAEHGQKLIASMAVAGIYLRLHQDILLQFFSCKCSKKHPFFTLDNILTDIKIWQRFLGQSYECITCTQKLQNLFWVSISPRSITALR